MSTPVTKHCEEMEEWNDLTFSPLPAMLHLRSQRFCGLSLNGRGRGRKVHASFPSARLATAWELLLKGLLNRLPISKGSMSAKSLGDGREGRTCLPTISQ